MNNIKLNEQFVKRSLNQSDANTNRLNESVNETTMNEISYMQTPQRDLNQTTLSSTKNIIQNTLYL